MAEFEFGTLSDSLPFLLPAYRNDSVRFKRICLALLPADIMAEHLYRNEGMYRGCLKEYLLNIIS